MRDRGIVLDERLTRFPDEAEVVEQFRFDRIDIVVLEGIFLFRRDLVARYDLRVWIECSFDVALERALVRNQEGESVEQLGVDYERIYFAAQRLHFALDHPRASADVLVD